MFEPESVTEINKDESINKCVLLGYEKIPEEQEYEFNIIDNNDNNNSNPSSINDEKTIEEKIRDYKNKIVNTMEDISENDEIIENKKNNNKIRNRNKNIESFTPNFNYNDDNYSNKMDYIKTFSNETTTCPNNNILTEMSEYKLQNSNRKQIQFPKNSHYKNNYINKNQDSIYSNNDDNININEKYLINKNNKKNKKTEKKEINNKKRSIKKNNNLKIDNTIDSTKRKNYTKQFTFNNKDKDNDNDYNDGNKMKLIKKNKNKDKDNNNSNKRVINNKEIINNKGSINDKDNKKKIIKISNYEEEEDINDNQSMKKEIIEVNKKPDNIEEIMKNYKNPFEKTMNKNEQIKEIKLKFILTKEEYLILMREKARFNNLLIE